MSDTNTVALDTFGALVDRLTAITWPVPAGQVEALIEAQGWRLEERVDDRSYVIDAGLGLTTRDPGWIWLGDGEVTSITISTSDDHADEQLPDAFRDGFADQVDAVTERVGAPLQRAGGGSPEAVWELPSQSWLVVTASWSGMDLTVTSPAEGRARAESER